MPLIANYVANDSCGRFNQPVSMSPERFRTVRDERGWTQDELAVKAGVSRSIIQSLERPESARKPDYRAPSRRKVLKVARTLGIEAEFISIPLPRGSYPIHGRVSASGWVDPLVDEEPRFVEFSGPHREGAFVLEIMGNSMAPRYLPGDLVLVVPVWETSELQPGDDIYVQCDGNEHDGRATFKMVRDVREGTLVLEPRNREFRPLQVECGNASRVARAVNIQRKVGRP